MNHDISKCELTHFFTFGKIYWKNYSEKINIDIINWEKLFDKYTEHKQCSIVWLVSFKENSWLGGCNK